MKKIKYDLLAILDKLDVAILFLLVYNALSHDKTSDYIFIIMLVLNSVKLVDASIRLKNQENFLTLNRLFFNIIAPIILIVLILVLFSRKL